VITVRVWRSTTRAGLGLAAAAAVLAATCTTASATFPGANGRLVYGEGPPFGPDHIITSATDGTDRHVIHSGGGLPSWSPDGQEVVFFDSPENVPHNTDVWAMAADGSNLRRLTTNPADDWNPAWSPDGSRIVFSSLRDGNREIYVMNADGSDQHDVSNMPGTWEDSPAWSSDGTRIAFDSYQGGYYQLFVMNADGSDRHNLLPQPANTGSPDWSPDSTQITFTSDIAGNDDVYVMNSDGSDVRQLTHGPSNQTVSVWSPDGTRLAFLDDATGKNQVYTMHADGSDVQQVTHEAQGLTYGVSWQAVPASPPGEVTLTKTADSGTAAAGGQDGYTITIDNGTDHQVTVRWLHDYLPAGFHYVPGSTTGSITTDPALSHQHNERLDWTAPVTLDPGASFSVHFLVTVRNRAGCVGNRANAVFADADSHTLVGTDGRIARICVAAAAR
jgi:uncharacterized repeat protein (TIGR01451 family)